MASYGFHSDAEDEYLAAIRYYRDHASPLVAAAFVAEVEGAIKSLLASPTTWAVIEERQIRRYLLKHFPYSISLGAGARSGLYLCRHAFQQATRLLASKIRISPAD